MTDPMIQEEIGGLADLDLVSLRSRWLGLYGSEAPARMSRELVIQAIAYRLQENAFGGLPSVIRARITGARGARIERTRIEQSSRSCMTHTAPRSSPSLRRSTPRRQWGG